MGFPSLLPHCWINLQSEISFYIETNCDALRYEPRKALQYPVALANAGAFRRFHNCLDVPALSAPAKPLCFKNHAIFY
jgi:hypothetical protein